MPDKPPSAIDAEERLLSLLIQDNQAIDTAASIIKGENFFLPKHRAIFDAMVDMRKNGLVVDLVTLVERMQDDQTLKLAGGASGVSAILTAPVAPDAKQYALIVWHKAMLRQLSIRAEEIAKMCNSGGDAIEIVSAAKDSIATITDEFFENDLIKQQRIEDLASRLEEWTRLAPGEFTLLDIINQFETKAGPKDLTIALERLVEVGVLERSGKRRCTYRPRKMDLEEIDYKTADKEPIKIWLPFGLQRLVNIMPGNIVMIAGAPNSGKTALLLNIALDNERHAEVHYFSSEMDANEMKLRLSKYSAESIKAMRFKAYHRDGDFGDVVKRGKGVINIIDFLEVHDEFYKVGQMIKDIYDNLDGAIAIIGMQKNPGNETGLGGQRMMEKARLALTLENNTLKITKAKNYAIPGLNPNGLAFKYKIVHGINLMGDRSKQGWYSAATGQPISFNVYKDEF